MKKREELDSNFEIGGVLADDVLPYSLEYYLGVEHEGDEDYEGEEDDEEDDEDEEDQGKNKKSSKSKSK